MKKNSIFWSLLTMIMVGMMSVGFVSCGDDDNGSDPDKVSVNMPSISIGQSGGVQVVSITSNTNWTVSGMPSWLTVSPMQGSGNGTIMLTAQANTERSSRSCVLNINAGSASTVITVSQQVDSTPSLEGSYVGTLKPMGYSDSPAPCYVTMTKLSSTTYRLSSLICEQFDINLSSGYNLVATTQSDGRITLTSETSYTIEGNYFQGTLTLSFAMSSTTFFFTGTKN